MKVGIIGYKGFVGSAIYHAFSSADGYEAVGIDRGNASPMKGSKFDILINANGNSSKRLAESDPAADFEMNAIATLGFLRDFPCKHYVHISTVEVYSGKASQQGTREDAKIDPALLSNYGFSKYCGELLAKRYAKSWLILRLAGMVGPGMKKGPAYDMLHDGKIYLSGKARLHFMHTREVARIALMLCERGKWGEIYNVAGKGNVSLSDAAGLAGVKLASEGTNAPVLDICTRKLEAECSVQASSKAFREFALEWKDGRLDG